MPWTVSIVRNLIPQVRASICDKSKDAVRDHAHFSQAYAQATAPRRTGAFAASIYVNGPENESDYQEHAGEARSLNPLAHIVPELRAAISDPKVGQLRDSATGRFTYPQAIVSSAVEYALYLEQGTVHMAPRPILTQAGLSTERAFREAMSKVADGF